jgi:hypothetical protein
MSTLEQKRVLVQDLIILDHYADPSTTSSRSFTRAAE